MAYFGVFSSRVQMLFTGFQGPTHLDMNSIMPHVILIRMLTTMNTYYDYSCNYCKIHIVSGQYH